MKVSVVRWLQVAGFKFSALKWPIFGPFSTFFTEIGFFSAFSARNVRGSLRGRQKWCHFRFIDVRRSERVIFCHAQSAIDLPRPLSFSCHDRDMKMIMQGVRISWKWVKPIIDYLQPNQLPRYHLITSSKFYNCTRQAFFTEIGRFRAFFARNVCGSPCHADAGH
ncbi:MAG: hypothetical protein EOM20_13435 [Spartobacteria bacterium]|nr:hypothetical protein [Spartobacteria bacterium]